MTIDELRLVPVPGDGLVARYPSVVFFTPSTSDPKVGELLELCRNVAASGALPGRMLARRVAGLLGASDDDYPPFCAIGRLEDGVAVTVCGPIDVVCVSDGEEVTLSGRESTTWLDRTVTGAVTAVCAGEAGSLPSSTPAWYDLTSGVAPARAFVLGPELSATKAPASDPTSVPAAAASPVVSADTGDPGRAPPAPAPAPAERPSRREHVDFESVVLVDAPPEPPRPALPTGPEAVEPSSHQAVVQGIVCSRSHFNDPNNLFCGVCGISLVQRTHNLIERPRPPLGFVVFEDATTYSLDIDYVIGRDPSDDPRVRSGDARALIVDDEERSVSRVHAEVHLEGWQVMLVDRGSTNGTFIWNQEAGAWSNLTPNEPSLLKPGYRAAVGRRTFLFESPFEHRVHE